MLTSFLCSADEWLLTEWGTPIGEMWDLETLSKVCEKEGRWTFFLTSAPLHVKGGVGTFKRSAQSDVCDKQLTNFMTGSPPGAIAIF